MYLLCAVYEVLDQGGAEEHALVCLPLLQRNCTAHTAGALG